MAIAPLLGRAALRCDAHGLRGQARARAVRSVGAASKTQELDRRRSLHDPTWRFTLAALNARFAPDCSRWRDDNGAAGFDPNRPLASSADDCRVAGSFYAPKRALPVVSGIDLKIRTGNSCAGLGRPRRGIRLVLWGLSRIGLQSGV
jgi:hypothetical protein